MNHHIKTILVPIQQAEILTPEQKEDIAKSLKNWQKELIYLPIQ